MPYTVDIFVDEHIDQAYRDQNRDNGKKDDGQRLLLATRGRPRQCNTWRQGHLLPCALLTRRSHSRVNVCKA
jgi:hypothetical protein